MNAMARFPCSAEEGSATFGPPRRTLRELLAGIVERPVAAIEITDLTLDSRAVQQGGVFLAVPGAQVHGVQHAAAALERGASAVLWEGGHTMPEMQARTLADARLIEVPNLSVLVGALADRFFGEPSADLRIAGITGTNGKTTCAYLLAAALSDAAAYLGTLGHGAVDVLEPSSHTTPDCVTVHRKLADFVAAGRKYVGMEVSSHALDQNRVANVRFDTAVFTNLTRDHLDYHGTEDAYAGAKARLFAWPHLRHAVINVDDARGRQLRDVAKERNSVTAFSARGPIDPLPGAEGSIGPASDGIALRSLWARKVTARPDGIEVELDGSWGQYTLRSPLIGMFNVENLLAVLSVLLGWDLPMERAIALLADCRPPPGRMEVYQAADDRVLVIDYAHTPDALSKALHALRQHRQGRIVCVFGCGGDRDAGKRPLMGHAAEVGADTVILTDDNPRGEAPDAIVAAIRRGMHRPEQARVEHDRARAIALAFELARPGDTVLIAGKGHESVQIARGEVRPFSDRDAVRQLLERHV
jgi:UDP-N-acetylmuramoyl-L-alanyl-D-glutamate--2,6-diaminopimelate ligase